MGVEGVCQRDAPSLKPLRWIDQTLKFSFRPGRRGRARTHARARYAAWTSRCLRAFTARPDSSLL